jgi:hypothetical protein
MKKLLFGILVVTSGFVYITCTQKSEFISSDILNTSDLVAADSQIDNIVEVANYESDVFSLSSSSVTSFSNGLKNGEIGGGIFVKMFDLFPNFKLRYLRGICPDLSLTTTNGGFPKTMTVDYGTGLELANGHILKGKIIVVISASPLVSGSTRTVTFENFCTDLVCISGTIIKTRTKDNQPKFSEKCNLTITKADGTTVHRVGEHARTWIAGSDTEFNPADDMIEVTGSIVVSDSKGNEYSKTITTPLLKTGVCKFITKGVIEFRNSAGKFATVDYGNGECDNKATRTNQDGTTVITLGR